MTIEALIRLIAGALVLVGIALAHFLGPWWLLLPAFVGANLVRSAFMTFCPPSILLRRIGWLDDAGRVRWGGRG